MKIVILNLFKNHFNSDLENFWDKIMQCDVTTEKVVKKLDFSDFRKKKIRKNDPKMGQIDFFFVSPPLNVIFSVLFF